MNFNARELNAIGHWSSSPMMPERYDRSVCANELLLRNTIIRKIIEESAMVPSPHLPESVSGDLRIGKAVDGPPILGSPLPQILQTWNKPLFSKAALIWCWRTGPLSTLTLHRPFPRPMHTGRSMTHRANSNVLNNH